MNYKGKMSTSHPRRNKLSDSERVMKKNIAIVHPLKESRPSSHEMNDTKSGIPEVACKKASFEVDLLLKDILSDNDPLMVKISRMLNRRNNRVIRNWKHLAQALGVPSDISLSFDCDAEHSPTEDLFDYLNTWKPDMNFKEMKVILRNAARNDLILILEKENYQDLWKVADNMDFVNLFKDKLDSAKRNMDWRSLASKCKIPRKSYEKFGKPKLGPTEHLFIHVKISKNFESFDVEQLKSYLQKMDRFDVLKAIERHKLQDKSLVKDVFKSQAPITDEVSSLLDKDGPMKNWKNLSYLMGIPDTTYENFDSSKGSNVNPTEMLFQWIFANKPELSVGKIIMELQSIERNDVVLEIINEVKPAFKEGRLQLTHSEEKMDAVVTDSSKSVDSSDEDRKLSQNLSHLTKQQRNALHVTALPTPVYEKLCNMLDVKEEFFKDYRMFAEELGMEKTKIRTFEGKKSPMHSILLEYKITIENFMKILKSIDREDVVVEVEKWLDQSPCT